ncbi:MAG: hypothetical protein R3264_13435, partial [Anaerolineae bacterium]|nr:hypothetical protein [Anaerolineae bacterium]
MRHLHSITLVAVILLLMIFATACGPAPSPEVASEASAEIEEESNEPLFEEFNAENFTNPTKIDNKWLPLTPGKQWVYEGNTVEDGESIHHRIEFTVTDLTKEIAGVETVAAWVEDFSDGELVEAELAFYAQDDDGLVWYFGEYPAEYEDGEFVAAPTWIAGIEEAKPGVKMRPEPRLGTPSYFQGWGPAVEWTDYAQIDQLRQQTCVPVSCYHDVMVIAESSLEEEDAYQLKYYAPHAGNIRVGWRGADATQEELELIEFAPLSAGALDQIRSAALALEEQAYEISPDVYGQTPPLAQT